MSDMATFKQFIAENAYQGFDLIGKLKTVEDLLNMKRVERSEPQFVAFQDAVAADTIYNVTLTEAKDAANYVFQNAFEKLHGSVEWTYYKHPVQVELNTHGLDLPFHLDGGNYKKVIRSHIPKLKRSSLMPRR
jgi:hypothetical protein